jgi:hypothetical protein
MQYINYCLLAGKDSMKQTFNVYPDVQPQELRRLAAQVCLTAFQELKGRDVLKALDAVLWMTGPDFVQWAEWAGLPFADPLPLLTNGSLDRTRVRRKGKSNERNFATV